ncbi:hypothetical protein NQZ68_024511 [Dissostichus eleginoides]|nr:hypothetical protein NQZ68_024511 [Dissostichus eleginoides]
MLCLPGVVRVVVTEESDAVLPCSPSTGEDLQKKLFDWKKVGQGGAKEHEVFMYDSAVHYDRHSGCDPCLKLENKHGKTAGAAPEPRTSIVDITELGVLLKCDVRGASPEPKVEWQDSEGNILPAEDPQVSERGGRYDVSIQTTVSKTSNNRFHCVATQQLIGHRVQANITVSEKLFEETFTEAEMNARFCGGIILGVLALAAVRLAQLQYSLFSKVNGSMDSASQYA